MAENEATLSILIDDATVSRLERAADAIGKSAEAAERATRVRERLDREQNSQLEQAEYEREKRRRGMGPTATERVAGGLRWAEQKLSNHGETGQLFAVFSRAMSNTAHAMEKMGDSTQTAGQRTQAFVESLPVLGQVVSSLRELGNAANGTADKLRLQSQSAERSAAHMAQVHAKADREIGIRVESGVRFGRASAAAAAADRGFAGLGVADPRNIYDPMQTGSWSRQVAIAQQEQSARVGLAEAQAKADALRREEAIARTGLAQARTTAMDSAGRLQEAKEAGQSWNWDNNIMGRGKAAIDDALRKHQQDIADLVKVEERLQNITLQRQGTALEMERKRGEILQSNIAREQERLNVLQQQGNLIRTQTQAFGAMLRPNRQLAVSFLQQAVKRGTGSLTKFQLDYLRDSGASQFVARELERRGEAAPETGQFRQLLKKLDDTTMPQSLGENLQAQQDVEKNLTELQKKMEASTTAAFSRQFEKFIETLLASMQRVVDLQAERVDKGQRIQNNARGN